MISIMSLQESVNMNELCDNVMRQTDYTREIAMEKLVQHDMKTDVIIREWMGIPTSKSKPSIRSNNQKIFDEFRVFLDDASARYYSTKKD